MKRLCLALFLLSSPAWAKLPKPANLQISTGGPAPVFSWDAVDGASFYRVAVFGPADESGKKPLMVAVWVDGLSYPYGSDKIIAKLGKLKSAAAKELIPGVNYKVMVASADDQGGEKSEWTSASFVASSSAVKAPQATATPSPESSSSLALSPTASPSATASPTPTDAAGNTQGAELEMDLAAEFKETPQAGSTGLSPSAVVGAPSVESARSLLQAGKAEQAEAMFKQLLNSDATNAVYWEGLGDSYDAQMMKIEAKEAYQKALDIDPKRDRLNKWMQDNVKQ